MTSLRGKVLGKVWLILGVLLGSVLSAEAQTPPRTGTGTIAGTVLSRATRQAVPYATVVVDGTSRKTMANAGGWFRIEGLPAGRVTLEVTAGGFLPLRIAGVLIGVDETTPLTVELQANPNYMERVQVTADKTPMAIANVAASATVVERRDMDLRSDLRLSSAIENTTGALVSTQFGVFESVSLRGMSRGDPEFTQTLVLVDGVPQTLSTNGARILTVPTLDAGSIEIVRGPNSALYGRTAIGGAVNMRTADPTATHEVSFEVGGGGFTTAFGSGRVSGPVKDWGGYYVSFGGSHDEGYYVDKTTNNFDVGYASFFAKFTFAPDAKSFGSVSYAGVGSNNSTPTNEPIVNGVLLHEIEPEFDRLTNLNLPGPNYDQGENRLTFNYSRELSQNFRLVNVTGYRNVNLDFIEDGDSIDPPYDTEANTLAMYPFSQDRNEKIFYEEARLEMTPQFGQLNDRFTVGGSYEYTNGRSNDDFIYTDPDLFGWLVNYLDPKLPARSTWLHDTGTREYSLNIPAVFVQYMVDLNPRFNVTAGGRWDHMSMDNTRSNGPTVDASFSAFSPKVSAAYKVLTGNGTDAPLLNVYGAYSQAFVPPRRPSSLTPPGEADPELHPTDFDNYEGGFKARMRGKLTLEATYFWMNETGVVLQRQTGPFFVDTNAGERDYRGLEATVGYDVNPKLSFFGNASFYHNRFGDFVVQSEEGDRVLTGEHLPIAPDFIINYGTRFKPRPDMDAIVEVKHVDSTYGSPCIEASCTSSNTFKIDSYALVDASLSWYWRSFRITLAAHNLLNDEYYGTAGVNSADPGRPRQILLSTAVKFK